MTLRRKTFLAVLLVLTALLAVFGFATRAVLGAGFARIEREAARGDVERVRDALAARIDAIVVKSADWAVWDDMYTFMEERGQAFRDGNLLDNNLATLQMNILVLVGADGTVIYQRGIELEQDGAAGHAVDAALLDQLVHHPRMGGFAAGADCHAGVIMVDRRPLIVAMRPVLPSNGKGSPRGHLVMARWFDEVERRRLAQVTHLETTLAPFAMDALPDECRAELAGPAGLAIMPVDEQRMAGYLRWDDLAGQPALLVSIALDRDVHREAAYVLRWLVLAILTTGLVLGAVIVLTLERTVLARLAGLGASLAEIGRNDDSGARVAATGGDEIGALGAEVNRVLAAKQRIRQQILERSSSMRLILDTIPVGLVALDADGRIQAGYSNATIGLLGRMDLAGVPLGETLAPGDEGAVTRRRLADFLDMARSGILPDDELDQINPVKEVAMRHAAGAATLRCRFYRIEAIGGGSSAARSAPMHTGVPGLGETVVAADGVLVTITDVSDERRLAAEAQRSQEEYQQLKTIAEDVDLFREYLGEARAILGQCADLVAHLTAGPADRRQLGDLDRGVRAINRGALAFGMPGVANVAGSLSGELSGLRRLSNLSDTEVRRCRYRLADLEGAVASVEGQFRSLLGNGQALDAGQRRPGLPSLTGPSDPELVRVAKRRALTELKGLRSVPARLALARSLKLVQGMAQRRKIAARLVVEGGDLAIEAGQAGELNAALLPLVRNAFDHGIEPAAERAALGKPEQGTLTLTLARTAEVLVVELADDGRGIDVQRVRQTAVLRGLISLAQSHDLDDAGVCALIFLPGYSGDGKVSDSGNLGIGLDVVAASVRSTLGGSIGVASTPGKGVVFTIRIPLADGIPSAAS